MEEVNGEWKSSENGGMNEMEKAVDFCPPMNRRILSQSVRPIYADSHTLFYTNEICEFAGGWPTRKIVLCILKA
jgi:hypothetical protein